MVWLFVDKINSWRVRMVTILQVSEEKLLK